MRYAAAAALLMILSACGEDGEGESGPATIGDLRAAIETDATCEELIEIKNAMDPKSADLEAAGDVLRGVGCFSVESERIDR
jgi:hypothetical protein